jgi:ATP-dependent exoDNAse (exonuclease V) beta subunit
MVANCIHDAEFREAAMTQRQPSDIAERRAVLDPAKSFAVRAPAGSGKTELLTQRVLTLLAVAEKPEEILAITFTKKAAAEMQQRILDALRLAHDVQTGQTPRPEKEHDRFTLDLATRALQRSQQQQWQLLENPNRLRIQTIDSFCRSLSGQQPVSSQLGTLPDTLEDNSAINTLLQQAFRHTLRELGSNNEIAEALQYLLLHFDNRVENLETLIINMLRKRDQWLPHLVAPLNATRIQYANRLLVEFLLQQAWNVLKPWHAELASHFNHVYDNLSRCDKPTLTLCKPLQQLPQPVASELEHWRDIFNFLTTADGLRSPKGFNKNNGVPVDDPLKPEIQRFFAELNDASGLEEIILASKQVPDHPVANTQLELMQKVRTVLLRTVAQLDVLFRQAGATDYTQIALAALDALGSEGAPSDLSLKLDYRIKHILVDEFQDTSHLQLRLLQKLTTGWQPEDGHSLFIVGDGMQSCYAFRNADVRIFLEATHHGIGSVPLRTITLKENFRSVPEIVAWNNRVFAQAFPACEIRHLSAVPYSLSTAFNTEQTTDAVRCYLIRIEHNSDDEGTPVADANQTEAEQIVALIHKLRKQAPDESIAILVRSRSHVAALLPQLKAANIPWQATDMDSLSQRMAIVDLMSLTRALLYPADRLAWLSFLRSPVVGLNLHDLHALAQVTDQKTQQPASLLTAIQNYTSAPGLSDSAKQILSRAVPLIKQTWCEQQRKPLRLCIEGLWYALGGPSTVLPAQLQDCEYFFTLLDQKEQAGQIIDWPALQQAIEQLYANETASDPNAVQVMTIHKAKGLQFDHVILPGLGKSPRQMDSEIFLWNEYYLDEQDVLVMASPQERGAEETDRHYVFLKSEAKKKADYEAVRLLYVACTRPKKSLHLFASIKTKTDGKEGTPPKNALVASIWETFRERAVAISAASPHTAGVPDSLEHIRRLPMNWQAPVFPVGNLLANYRGQEFQVHTIIPAQTGIQPDRNIPELTSLANFLARQTGTVIHRSLQQIVELGLAYTPFGRITEQKPEWQQQLIQLGVPARFIKQALAEVETALQKTLASEQGRWILDTRHEQSACELELFFNDQLSIIDRSFVYQDACYVIDYKTAVPDANQSLDVFLQQQLAQYQPQLEHYRLLMQKKSNLPTKVALYFPLLDQLVFWKALECGR